MYSTARLFTTGNVNNLLHMVIAHGLNHEKYHDLFAKTF